MARRMALRGSLARSERRRLISESRRCLMSGLICLLHDWRRLAMSELPRRRRVSAPRDPMLEAVRRRKELGGWVGSAGGLGVAWLVLFSGGSSLERGSVREIPWSGAGSGGAGDARFHVVLRMVGGVRRLTGSMASSGWKPQSPMEGWRKWMG